MADLNEENPPSAKHAGGRTSKYDPSMCERVRAMCERGAVDKDIADALGIGLSTLYRWKVELQEFRDALKRGKDVADDVVEAALFRRATGYTHDAVKIMTVSVGDGSSRVEEVPYVEHYAPDTTAAIFWLKNRRPEAWRDKREVELSGEVSTGPDLSTLSTDERAVMKELLLKAEAAKTKAEGVAP